MLYVVEFRLTLNGVNTTYVFAEFLPQFGVRIRFTEKHVGSL